MSLINFRIATEEDAEVVAEISRRTFSETFATDNSEQDMQLFLEQSFTLDVVLSELKDRRNTFLLSYSESELIGYAKLSDSTAPAGLDSNNSVEIARIYSTKERVGTGVGKALMSECLRFASDQGKEVIWLGVWERNVRAIKFYEQWGFQKFGEHFFLLGNDRQNDWLMRKVL